MKKILMILCLALALCMLCGMAMAEAPAEPAEPEAPITRTIYIKNDIGETIKEIVVTKTVEGDLVKWLDENGYDWGDEDIFVKTGHDYSMDDTDYPENNDNVVVVFMPNVKSEDGVARNGQFRVHCKNHPNDKEDVIEYTIYWEDHVFPTEKKVMDAIAKGTFNKNSFIGFKSYTKPNCATGKAGKAVVTCICDSQVHWDYTTGKYVGHDPLCTKTKSYTIKAEHLWSDENPDKAVGQPYHDLLKPTCYTEGKVVGYCLLCGIDKNEVKGDSAIVTVEPLAHHTITGEPAWEVRMEIEANCIEPGKETLYCTICKDWIPDAEAHKIDANYPKTIAPNGKHVYSVWIFDDFVKDAKGNDMEPTCTKDGMGYFHRICQKCHTVFGTEKRVIPAEGHTFPDKWTDVAGNVACCTIPGLEERTCLKCLGNEAGGHEVREKAKDDMKHYLVEGGKVVYDNGIPVSALILDASKPATCLTDGWNKYHCSMCGQLVTEIVPALGHKWSKDKSYQGWCGGTPAKPEDPALVEKDVLYANCNYTYKVCDRCGKIEIVEDLGVCAHNFNEWEWRNDYQLYDDGGWTPEYWVRYCKNVLIVNGVVIDKCAYHEDFIRDFAVRKAGKTPNDVLAEENAPVVPEEPVPTNETFEMPEDVTAVKDGGRYKIKGNVDINDKAALPEYAFVRLTLFYFDGSAEVTFTSLNLKTGAFTYASSKPFAHVSAVVLDNNEEINDVPADQQYSNGAGWTYTMADYE